MSVRGSGASLKIQRFAYQTGGQMTFGITLMPGRFMAAMPKCWATPGIPH